MKLQLQDIAHWTGADLRTGEGDRPENRRRNIQSTPARLRRVISFLLSAGSATMRTPLSPPRLSKGARAVVVARSKVTDFLELARTHSLLIVDDPLVALQTLATAVRRHWNKRISASPAAPAKPPPRKRLRRCWARDSDVLRSKGNLNNESACPCNYSNWNRSMKSR